jgi:hypothetical protein
MIVLRDDFIQYRLCKQSGTDYYKLILGPKTKARLRTRKTAQAIPVVRGLGSKESTMLDRRPPRSTITASQPE